MRLGYELDLFFVINFVVFFFTVLGQFNAAPTLLEKQQESLCARLKSFKEKQGLALGVGAVIGVGSGVAGLGVSRSRYSSFSETTGLTEFSFRRGGRYSKIMTSKKM